MFIASIAAVAAAPAPPTIARQTADPSSPDYIPPLPPHPGPAPARLPDITYQANPNGADGPVPGTPGSAASLHLTAVRSALLTVEPDSVAPLTTAPQPLQQPGPIQPTLALTL